MLADDVQERLQSASGAWSADLNATGGAINPEKSCWIFAGYTGVKGIWRYAPQPDMPMEIPPPDGSFASISQGEVSTTEKALGIWLTVDSSNEKHLKKKLVSQVNKRINKMKNGHLPSKLGWVAYRFKLWPGERMVWQCWQCHWRQDFHC
jgi:hypothetical protein